MNEGEYFHVIMPVGSDPDWQEKATAIKQAAVRNGVSVRFPDYVPKAPVFRLIDLKRELAGAAFVLADLTLERPSCYYELGLAEALGLRVCLVAESETPIHQSAARSEVRYFRNLVEFDVVVDRAIKEFLPISAKTYL
jgi:hypothetical protein